MNPIHKLLFCNEYKERLIAEIESTGKTGYEIYREAMDHVRQFCEDRNFHIYYVRVWSPDDRTILDVGSHTEFFHIVPAIDPNEGDPDNEA